MLLEKRALWLRKEQARKKRVAEVLRSHPKHNRIPHLISSNPDRRPSNQRQRPLNWLARACVAGVCAALSDVRRRCRAAVDGHDTARLSQGVGEEYKGRHASRSRRRQVRARFGAEHLAQVS